jgi:enterochelin esterase-like enzyme
VTGSFRSSALNRTMPYAVYLPPGYDADPNARFPSLYMLHGGSGTYQEWIDYGLLKAADTLMGNRTIPQFLIVLPQGDQEYWVDHIPSNLDRYSSWGTYMAMEVVPEIDRSFRTYAQADLRAIGGLSMGGHAAMQLPMNFPGVWDIIGAHSPSLRPEGAAPTYLGRGADFAARDPLDLITAKPDIARGYTWWIDSGDVDPWITQATAIHNELDAIGIPNIFHRFTGDHSAAYWSAHVTDYLMYYGEALR